MSRRRKGFGTREWEHDLAKHVSEHGRVEGEILDEYRDLADDDETAPGFRYLAEMILADEVRHHQIFADLAATLDRSASDEDGDAPIPSLEGFYADRVRIQRVTDALLEIERGDERELKDLAKRLKEFDKITLWGLLIDIMLDDTRKHIKILRFIRERSEDQPN